MVPRLDVVAQAIAVVLQKDGAAERGKVGVRQFWIVFADLIVERHYAALARKPWKKVGSPAESP